MSKLYKARVDAVTERQVTLTVWQIHPDAGMPPTSKTFALALVHAAGHKKKKWALDQEVARLVADSDQAWLKEYAKQFHPSGALMGILSERWMQENAARFIASVVLKRQRNEGSDEPYRYASGPGEVAAANEYWSDQERLPQAVLELTATDAAWVSHLTPGLEWETAAYDMGQAKPLETTKVAKVAAPKAAARRGASVRLRGHAAKNAARKAKPTKKLVKKAAPKAARTKKKPAARPAKKSRRTR